MANTGAFFVERPREHLGECGGRFSAPLAEPPKSTPRSMWFCLLHLVSDLQGLVHFLGKFEVKSEVESISVWMRRLTRMPDYAARGPNLVRKNVDGPAQNASRQNPSQLRIRAFVFVAGTYNSARKIPNQRNLGERVSLQGRTERVKTFSED
ncbi:uncharacterized protein CIMG_04418 [Coccidioides immitis RS]|uniref:Uncharacterized protein n=1 Tax=Coccidioides immitis (strain RS) TaxID=246410 RepID=J3KDG1_COCIM|nr:uncharacterized protein CIMG_04418 [Coccidioides immitis RS]EAS33394.3 hypothetical protein CIMG_04418 [Coccidioides immitis RS]